MYLYNKLILLHILNLGKNYIKFKTKYQFILFISLIIEIISKFYID